MSSLVHTHRNELKMLGEYVVLANVASGWFAVFENTLLGQIEKSNLNGRSGPNLIIYRTINGEIEPRDHYVIPNSVFAAMITDKTVATAKLTNTRRWNFTLKNDHLHVTHGGSSNVSEYYKAKLLIGLFTH